MFGAAAGLNMQVLSMAAQNNAAKTDLGAVSATVGFLRSLGTTAGLTVFSAVFTSSFGVDNPAGYASALNGVFWAMVPALAIGLAVALFLPRVPLRRHH